MAGRVVEASSPARPNAALDRISSSSFARAMLALAPCTAPSGVSTHAYTFVSPTQYATSVDSSRVAIAVKPSSVGGGAEASLLSEVATAGAGELALCGRADRV